MNDQVESNLRRLPEPAPPTALKATVMARVSRLAEERPPARRASPAPAVREDDSRGRIALPAWVPALAGLIIVCISWISGRLEAGWWLELTWRRLGEQDSGALPFNTYALLGLGLGLLLYLAGLFTQFSASGKPGRR